MRTFKTKFRFRKLKSFVTFLTTFILIFNFYSCQEDNLEQEQTLIVSKTEVIDFYGEKEANKEDHF